MFSELALHSNLLKALDKLSFTEPTEVQARVIPQAIAGDDLLVSAETGSGKTAAFLLPLLHRMLEQGAPNTATRALILTPTRELARQVFKQYTLLSEFTGIKAGLITGGDSLKYQKAILRKNPEIVIATPGRLLEHVAQRSADLSDLEILVLDEADRMLDLGFSDEVLKVAAACRPERQTLLLSATLDHRGLQPITRSVLREPKAITLSSAQDQHERIRQQIVTADDNPHKDRLTTWLLAHESYAKALIFTNTRAQADRLGGVLRYHNLRAGVLHGEMDQDQRNRVMDLLRRGSIDILVATDVAARGLDVKGVDLVINYDMTRSGDDHVHRVGRTGRAGAEGLAISLISPQEWNLMASIERYLRVHFERRTIKELQGSFKGPKKLKSSGKAAGSKKKKTSAGKDTSKKPKQRLRDRKNLGKRRAPAANGAPSDSEVGFQPLRKKPNPE